jgi:ketosteroid isomerase-like protein
MTTSGRREANYEAVRRYCDAWLAGDVSAIVDCYAEHLTLHYFGRSPLAGEHVGKQAALAVLFQVQQRPKRKPLAIHDVLASDDHAIVMARERFEREGRVCELNRLLVYNVRDGKLVECWIYDADQRLVDEFLA